MAKKLRIGFDFDGVIAYNPLRVFRLPVTLFQKYILGKKKTYFYLPKSGFGKWFWGLLHETSVFPATGIEDLKKLIRKGKIEAYIITGRYSFLEKSFHRWLKRHKLDNLFTGYYLNKADEQPHLFKEKIIQKLKLDMFIEDNWDIVRYLNSKFEIRNSKQFNNVEIHWIYNLLDRTKKYKNKHPYLKKFLLRIFKD